MITLSSTFDMVHDVTAVFRALLEAMANPGREVSWPVAEEPMLAAAVTLLDGETGFCWDRGEEMIPSVEFLTGSRTVTMEEADFLFVEHGADREAVLAAAKPGTHEDPHRSATILTRAKGERTTARLSGPGVEPGSTYRLPIDILAWMDHREEQCHEFPCGVDMVFFTDEGVIAIPRTTRKGER